eukprot:GILI01017243.1.p1 GENE.GILI01017243.1~~GILI01017243.1.p1  ORF type:complete len:278 (-),score=16.47 GILI01017243.1:139-936(-)
MHMNLRLLFVATTLMVSTALAVVFQDAGFSDQLAPVYPRRPYVGIPADTTAVSEKVQREVVLSCSEESPVFRACNCDILSWDSCGNIFGLSGQEADWQVSVTHMTHGDVSRLVSPITFLRDGVARFYFTPTVIGPYNVTVWRSPASTQPSLYTGTTLSNIVMVHDVTATCSHNNLNVMLPVNQDLLWAHSQYLNERRKEAGMSQYSVATNINVDHYTIYSADDATLQQDVRRSAIQPYAPKSVIPRQSDDDNNVKMCDMVKHTFL